MDEGQGNTSAGGHDDIGDDHASAPGDDDIADDHASAPGDDDIADDRSSAGGDDDDIESHDEGDNGSGEDDEDDIDYPPDQEFKDQKFTERSLWFEGIGESIVNFTDCHFRDVSVTFGGTETVYSFENCTWERSQVTLPSFGNCYTFQAPTFTDSVIIGGDGELTLESAQNVDPLVTPGAVFCFTYALTTPTFTNVTIQREEEESFEDEHVDQQMANCERCFEVDEEEMVDFVRCEFFGGGVNMEVTASDEPAESGDGSGPPQ